MIIKMKNNISISILLLISLIGCSQNHEFARISTNTNNVIEFEGLKYNTIEEFSVVFENWVTEQKTIIESPIVEFRPNPEAKMEFVNKLKDVLKEYHNILRVSIVSQDGKQMLVKFPPRINKKDIPDLSFLKKRNILNFKVSESGIFKDSLMKQSIPLEQVIPLVLDYIISDGTNHNLPEKTIYKIPEIGVFNAATKLIITLKYSPEVTFNNYEKVKWEILSGYENARNMKSNEIYKRDYGELIESERKLINEIIPIMLSELPW